jgi:ABC-type Zn uptake system ZnuABC Zn-binding protein ZnuA
VLKRCLACLLLLLLTTACLLGCKKNNTPKNKPEIAVSNAYLLSAVKDLCGSQIEVVSLSPPGMCPGHFDISPAQVEQLSKCKVLLLFDFQSGIGDSLSRLQERGLKIHGIIAPQGLCLPETYLAIVRSVAEALSKDNPVRRAEFDERIELIEKRLNALAADVNMKIDQSGLKNAEVLVSGHQAEFAKWLGLNVVATFAGSDIETPSRINASLQQAKDKNITLVVANQQEGTELAKALAKRLNAKMVVFSNFPMGQGDVFAFDSLLLENISGLLKNEK